MSLAGAAAEGPRPFREFEARAGGELHRQLRPRRRRLGCGAAPWTPEWFTISPTHLVALPSMTSGQASLCVSLEHIRAVEACPEKGACSFRVRVASQLGSAPCDAVQELLLRARDAGEMQSWVSAIQGAKELAGRFDRAGFVPLARAREELEAERAAAAKARLETQAAQDSLQQSQDSLRQSQDGLLEAQDGLQKTQESLQQSQADLASARADLEEERRAARGRAAAALAAALLAPLRARRGARLQGAWERLAAAAGQPAAEGRDGGVGSERGRQVAEGVGRLAGVLHRGRASRSLGASLWRWRWAAACTRERCEAEAQTASLETCGVGVQAEEERTEAATGMGRDAGSGCSDGSCSDGSCSDGSGGRRHGRRLHSLCGTCGSLLAGPPLGAERAAAEGSPPSAAGPPSPSPLARRLELAAGLVSGAQEGIGHLEAKMAEFAHRSSAVPSGSVSPGSTLSPLMASARSAGPPPAAPAPEHLAQLAEALREDAAISARRSQERDFERRWWQTLAEVAQASGTDASSGGASTPSPRSPLAGPLTGSARARAWREPAGVWCGAPPPDPRGAWSPAAAPSSARSSGAETLELVEMVSATAAARRLQEGELPDRGPAAAAAPDSSVLQPRVPGPPSCAADALRAAAQAAQRVAAWRSLGSPGAAA